MSDTSNAPRHPVGYVKLRDWCEQVTRMQSTWNTGNRQYVWNQMQDLLRELAEERDAAEKRERQ